MSLLKKDLNEIKQLEIILNKIGNGDILRSCVDCKTVGYDNVWTDIKQNRLLSLKNYDNYSHGYCEPCLEKWKIDNNYFKTHRIHIELINNYEIIVKDD